MIIDEMVLTTSLDGTMKVVMSQSSKNNANFSIDFDCAKYDIDLLNTFGETHSYSYKYGQK